MRVFGFIIIFSLVVGAYASAAHAFGLIASCDPAKMASMRMMDCCDHDQGKPMPSNCVKCDCCSASVMTPALVAALAVLAVPPAPTPDAALSGIAVADFRYPQLRPPDSVA